METTSSQRISWYSRFASTASWASNGIIDGINSAASKTAHAWVHTPKALKLPLETAAIFYAPVNADWQRGGLVAAAAMIETPKNLAAFLSNRPLQYIGQRWQLIPSSFPEDPKLPLTDLDKKIGTFERAQPPLVNPPAPLNPVNNPLASITDSQPVPLRDMEEITDKNLEILIEKISYFSILKAMHAYCGVPESDAAPLLRLVDEASRTQNPSLWKIFTSHYGSKMSLWGRFKAGFIYLFLWNAIPIIPKTVDAYLKNMLNELRINLKENGEKRKKFINGLLDDADNFFEVYNGAAETYANDNARKGNLNHYRKNAIDLMLPREDLKLEKTPEELRMDLYRKLSASIVDHFSPKVRFGFLEGWLNNRIKSVLRDQILPEVFHNISDEGQEATKRHNIPFFLALTKTLTAQVSKVQGKIEEEPSDSSSLYGIKNFEPIVKKFLWTIDMADCKTAEEVRAKMEKLKHAWTAVDAEVRNGIQLGIQKGLAVLFDYLSKQENTEELFANLFESVTAPLSGGHLPMNDKQWAEVAVEYEGAKILLKQAGSALSKQIVQAAIQDTVRGGNIPEATERTARKIFSDHKTRGKETYEELLRICGTIQEKLHQSKDSYTDDTSIHPDLGEIASTLKAFENKERVKITMEQDPPPQIANLSRAEQEAILRVLYPVYEGSNQIMDHVLSLQILQKQHVSHFKSARELRQLKDAIEEIASNQTSAPSPELIDRMTRHFRNLEALEPALAANLQGLKEQIDSICRMLTQIGDEQRALDALAQLQPFPSSEDEEHKGLIDQLVLAVQNNPLTGFKKWRCIDLIKKNVKTAAFSAIDQQIIFELIDKMSKFNSLPEPRPDFNQEIWEPLAILLNERKTLLERNQKRTAILLERSIPLAHHSCSLEELKINQLSQEFWGKMEAQGDLLQAEVLRLYKKIQCAQKEVLLHPSASQLGQIGGTLGFLAGLAAGSAYPEGGHIFGSVLGAAAASTVANLGSLAKGKWLKFSIPVLGSGAAAGFATHYLAEAAKPYFPGKSGIPALIGAAGASAGFEYVGAKITKQLIDTGVDVAMPKVTQIFDSAYEHLLTSDIVINGGLKIMMKQMVDLFPPKK